MESVIPDKYKTNQIFTDAAVEHLVRVTSSFAHIDGPARFVLTMEGKRPMVFLAMGSAIDEEMDELLIEKEDIEIYCKELHWPLLRVATIDLETWGLGKRLTISDPRCKNKAALGDMHPIFLEMGHV